MPNTLADASSSIELVAIRHPKVVLPDGICYGATDVPASAGHAAQCAAAWTQQWQQPGSIRRSPARRCDAVSAAWPLHPIAVDPDLKEFDFGCWEMQAWSSLGPEVFDPWMADFLHHRPGGMDNTDGLMRRVARALVRDLQAPEVRGPRIWVTHAGVIRSLLLLHQQTELRTADQWPQAQVAFGAALTLRFSRRWVASAFAQRWLTSA